MLLTLLSCFGFSVDFTVLRNGKFDEIKGCMDAAPADYNWNTPDQKGSVPLIRISENENMTDDQSCVLAELLVGRGVDPKIEHKNNKKTALHRAASCNKPKLVKLLHEKGADLEKKDALGFTPLIDAAYFEGNRDALKELCCLGANLEAKSSNEGKTALLYAAEWGCVGNFLALVECGADIIVFSSKGENVEDLLTKALIFRNISADNYKKLKDFLSGRDTVSLRRNFADFVPYNRLQRLVRESKPEEEDKTLEEIKRGIFSEEQTLIAFEEAVRQGRLKIANHLKSGRPSERVHAKIDQELQAFDAIIEELRLQLEREMDEREPDILDPRAHGDMGDVVASMEVYQNYVREKPFRAAAMEEKRNQIREIEKRSEELFKYRSSTDVVSTGSGIL